MEEKTTITIDDLDDIDLEESDGALSTWGTAGTLGCPSSASTIGCFPD